MPTPETLARIASLRPEQRAALEARAEQLGLSHFLQERPSMLASGSGVAGETRDVRQHLRSGPALAVFFFSDDGSRTGTGKYDLLMRAAAFADRNDFSAVWTPERHFHSFGGLYPNPAILGAALAMITKRVAIRAGSVVLPLHHPARVAEEWSVVDNLSGGRIGAAFASGWRQDDFILATTSFDERRTVTSQAISKVRALWRGERVQFATASGESCNIRIFPRPIQPELPSWLAVAGHTDTWRLAGRMGLNVLTMLGTQNIAVLAGKINAYTESLAAHGHTRSQCRITIVLHTLVGNDEEQVRRCADAPMKRYLSRFLSQLDDTGDNSKTHGHSVTGPDMLCSAAFDWYFERAGLFGTPDRCKRLVQELAAIGVDEIACLLDFGADPSDVIASLPFLNELREEVRSILAPPEKP